MSITLLFLIFAAICFLIATAGVATRINLTALGLFFWVLTQLIR